MRKNAAREVKFPLPSSKKRIVSGQRPVDPVGQGFGFPPAELSDDRSGSDRNIGIPPQAAVDRRFDVADRKVGFSHGSPPRFWRGVQKKFADMDFKVSLFELLQLIDGDRVSDAELPLTVRRSPASVPPQPSFLPRSEQSVRT